MICPICSNRKKLLKSLKRKFKADLSRNEECIIDMGISFLFLQKPTTCPKCQGRGWELDENHSSNNISFTKENGRENCATCNGTGKMLSKDMYISDLLECKKCKSIVGTISTDLEQTKHYHK